LQENREDVSGDTPAQANCRHEKLVHIALLETALILLKQREKAACVASAIANCKHEKLMHIKILETASKPSEAQGERLLGCCSSSTSTSKLV
jgi:hypothetical protein